MRKACLTCHALGGRAGTLGGQDPHAVLPFGMKKTEASFYFDGSRCLTGRGSKARIFTELRACPRFSHCWGRRRVWSTNIC